MSLLVGILVKQIRQDQWRKDTIGHIERATLSGIQRIEESAGDAVHTEITRARDQLAGTLYTVQETCYRLQSFARELSREADDLERRRASFRSRGDDGPFGDGDG